MLFLAMAAVVIGAAPAAAGPARGTVDYDVQCMLAIQMAADQGPAETKDKLGLATMFYFGRVDSAISNDEALRSRLRADAKTIEGKPLAPILQDCGQFMAERGLVMVQIGQALEAEEKAGKTN